MAEAGWTQHVNDCADITLFPAANSWYMGANVPGKPRVFLPYSAGVDFYRASCDEVVARDYLGFKLSGPEGSMCNDGVVRRLQPDVEMVLNADGGDESADRWNRCQSTTPAPSTLRCQRLVRLDPTSARSSMACCPAPTGDLAYRLYRPPTPGPHPIVVFFHGGGWVAGRRRSRTIRCAGTCACGATRSSSRRTTATRRSTDSPQQSMTPWPRCGGSPTTPRHSAASRDGSRCAAGARAAISRRWFAGSPGTRVDRHIVGQVLLTPLNRRRHDTRLLRRECGRLRSHHGAGPWLLRPLHRPRRSTRSPLRALVRRRSVRAAAGDRGHGRVRSPSATKARPTPPRSRRQASRRSMSVRAATPTSR